MYIDSNIFIFAAMDNGKLGEVCREIIRLINANRVSLTASLLVVDEVIWVLKKNIGKEDAIRITKTMLSMPIKWITIQRSVIVSMLDVHERTDLDPRDALHVSSMRESSVSIIVSEDEDFDRITGIERLNASQFMERYG